MSLPLPRMAFVPYDTAREVSQYWPLCHDYIDQWSATLSRPTLLPKLAFVPWTMTMTPAMYTGDDDNDDDDNDTGDVHWR